MIEPDTASRRRRAVLIATALLAAIATLALVAQRLASGGTQHEEVPFSEATSETVDVELDSQCEGSWTMSGVSGLSTAFVRNAVDSMKFPITAHDLLPKYTQLEVRLSTGQRVALSNITLLDVYPTNVKLGLCRDDLEWLRAQDAPTQLYERTTRSNDGMQVVIGLWVEGLGLA